MLMILEIVVASVLGWNLGETILGAEVCTGQKCAVLRNEKALNFAATETWGFHLVLAPSSCEDPGESLNCSELLFFKLTQICEDSL